MSKPPKRCVSKVFCAQINGVRDLLPYLIGVPVTYIFEKKNSRLEGFVADGGYACACHAAASCGYRGKVLSALQFEKHARAESKNQNGHIFLRNGKSLYDLFQELRDVPAEAFAEEFREAAGVPMTVAAAESLPASQGARRGQQANWETNGVQTDSVTSGPPSAPAPARDDVQMLTEDENASLCLFDVRENRSMAQSDPMQGLEGPASEWIEDAAGGDHGMPDAKEIRKPRYRSLSTIPPAKVQVTETKYQPDSYLKGVRGLLSTGLLEGFNVTYKKDKVETIGVGRISGQNYSCGCSECNYSSDIMNACEFEHHCGQLSYNQNAHIFLESGISLFKVVKALKHCRLNMLGESIEKIIGFPPNLDEYNKWKASFQKRKDHLGVVASHGCSTESPDYLKESEINGVSNLNWIATKSRSGKRFRQEATETSNTSLSGSPDNGVSGLSIGTSKKSGTEETSSESIDGVKPVSPEPTSDYSKYDCTNLGISLPNPVINAQETLPNCSIDSKSKESKTRDYTLHPLIFKEGGLQDNTTLTYKLKNGEVLKQGYKQGTGIICNCCNQEFTPSHFEEHAGRGTRRQLYYNIYTPEGITLHELALQLQGRLYSNGFGNANVPRFSDYPNLTPSGRDKDPCTISGPIAPLKRMVQERVVKTESCYFCGNGHTMIGNIDPDMVVFCNQCERPCHVKCYNKRLEREKVPLEVLKEYVHFRFFCCKECQLLRARLDNELENCEEIACFRQIGSNICWRFLNGFNASIDAKVYLPQVIDIIKDAFVETTDENSDAFSDMVYAKDAEAEKDFRGMYCALLTASPHVQSAAILKVHIEQVAELVLVATRRECRRKGYFVLLLKLIETRLKDWNVSSLIAPVDPEMAQIWSEKLGFTVLSAKEKKSMLESHPLVMFESLVLVQKSLA